MLNDYKPSVDDLAKVLELLGLPIDGDPKLHSLTEASYPDLVGYLLAAADATAANVLPHGVGDVEVINAYRDAFLDPDLWGAPKDWDGWEAWDSFIIALTDRAFLVYDLHKLDPTQHLDPVDRTLAQAAGKAAFLAMKLASMRLQTALEARDAGGDPISSDLPTAAVLATELATSIAAMDSGYPESETPYVRRVMVDLGDDYDQVMAGHLDQMVAGGYIDGWEHQPDNGGNGNGSIYLIGGGKYKNLVMNYEDALEYASGYMAAVEDTAKKDED